MRKCSSTRPRSMTSPPLGPMPTGRQTAGKSNLVRFLNVWHSLQMFFIANKFEHLFFYIFGCATPDRTADGIPAPSTRFGHPRQHPKRHHRGAKRPKNQFVCGFWPFGTLCERFRTPQKFSNKIISVFLKLFNFPRFWHSRKPGQRLFCVFEKKKKKNF